MLVFTLFTSHSSLRLQSVAASVSLSCFAPLAERKGLEFVHLASNVQSGPARLGVTKGSRMSTRATPQLIQERRRDAKDDYETVLAEMAKRFVESMDQRYPGYKADHNTRDTRAKLQADLDARLRAVTE